MTSAEQFLYLLEDKKLDWLVQNYVLPNPDRVMEIAHQTAWIPHSSLPQGVKTVSNILDLRELEPVEVEEIIRFILPQVLRADPTVKGNKKAGKFAQWILNCWLYLGTHAQSLFIKEDWMKTRGDLQTFLKVQRKLPEPDINKAFPANGGLEAPDGFTALWNAMEKVREEGDDETAKEAALAGTKVLIDNEGWFAAELNTFEASVYWGKGTRWCTAHKDNGKHYFDEYSEGSPLIFILDKGADAKYQFHLYSSQYMDREDRGVDMEKVAEIFSEAGLKDYAIKQAMEVGATRLLYYIDKDKALEVFIDQKENHYGNNARGEISLKLAKEALRRGLRPAPGSDPWPVGRGEAHAEGITIRGATHLEYRGFSYKAIEKKTGKEPIIAGPKTGDTFGEGLLREYGLEDIDLTMATGNRPDASAGIQRMCAERGWRCTVSPSPKDPLANKAEALIPWDKAGPWVDEYVEERSNLIRTHFDKFLSDLFEEFASEEGELNINDYVFHIDRNTFRDRVVRELQVATQEQPLKHEWFEAFLEQIPGDIPVGQPVTKGFSISDHPKAAAAYLWWRDHDRVGTPHVGFKHPAYETMVWINPMSRDTLTEFLLGDYVNLNIYVTDTPWEQVQHKTQGIYTEWGRLHTLLTDAEWVELAHQKGDGRIIPYSRLKDRQESLVNILDR